MILQVKRAQRGDTGAFAALIEENKMALRRIAHGFFESEEDVADVLQETVLNAFEHLPELKNARYFKTWLVRILINNCNSLYRENRRSVPFDELPETVPAAPPPCDLEFFEMLRSLPPDSRLIFQLYYGERFTTREIAGMLKMNESTVKSRLSRGKKQLREGLRFQGLA